MTRIVTTADNTPSGTAIIDRWVIGRRRTATVRSSIVNTWATFGRCGTMNPPIARPCLTLYAGIADARVGAAAAIGARMGAATSAGTCIAAGRIAIVGIAV